MTKNINSSFFRHNSFTFTEYTKTIASNKQTYLAKTFFILFHNTGDSPRLRFSSFYKLIFLHKKEGIPLFIDLPSQYILSHLVHSDTQDE